MSGAFKPIGLPMAPRPALAGIPANPLADHYAAMAQQVRQQGQPAHAPGTEGGYGAPGSIHEHTPAYTFGPGVLDYATTMKNTQAKWDAATSPDRVRTAEDDRVGAPKAGDVMPDWLKSHPDSSINSSFVNPYEPDLGKPRAGNLKANQSGGGFRSMAPGVAQPQAPGQPAMLADPSKAPPQIGVPARNQAQPAIQAMPNLDRANAGPSPVRPANHVYGVDDKGPGPSPIAGFQSVPPTGPAAPDFSTQAGMRQAMLESLGKQMLDAHAAGDHAKLYDLFAQRGALDNGGFEGHARYIQARDKNQAGIDLSRDKGDNLGKNGQGVVTPEKLHRDILLKTGSQDLADQAVRNQRITAARANAQATGQPVVVHPEDATEIMMQGYKRLAPLFGINAQGGVDPGKGTLRDLHSQLMAAAPQLMADPGSEFSQAAGHLIRQRFGTDLGNQLTEAADPQQYFAPKLPSTGVGWIDGVADRIPALGADLAGRVVNATRGYNPLWDNAAVRQESQPSIDWARSLLNPVRPANK